MNMSKSMTAALAVLTLTLVLAEPASAIDTPKEAIGQDTALVVWLDLEQVDAEMIEMVTSGLAGVLNNPMLQEQGIGLPLGDLGEMVDGLTTFRSGFVGAGGQGLLLTMQLPGEGSWSPPISLLTKTTDDVDAQAMGALVRTMTEGKMDAQLAPVADGWHDLSIVSADGEAVTQALPGTPDKTVYKAFDQQLGEIDEPVICIAFRMQDQIREMIGQAAEGVGEAGEAGAGQDPVMAMLIGMLQPLKSLDTLGFSISQDDDEIEVDIQMVFLEAGEAQLFAQNYNTIMTFAPVLLAGELQNIENAPDPNTLNNFFMKLQMKVNGDTLKLNLDQEFFDMVQEMAPLFEAMGIEQQQQFDL